MTNLKMMKGESMKKLYIDRTRNIKDATVGTFELKDGSITLLKGVTLEPAGEDTVTPNKDRRIPEGEYNATFYRSPRFQRRLPILYNEKVSKDRHILIHNGNFPDDTLGCILVGSRDDNKGIYNSVDTLSRLLNFINYDNFKVIIKNQI